MTETKILIPLTNLDLSKCIARETARMSYPGSMSRGKNPVVISGTKEILENYFTVKFPINELWKTAVQVAQKYDEWHCSRSLEISSVIRNQIGTKRNRQVVAAKFLDTFMHQLMKYEQFRSIWNQLHLPLDRRIFNALKGLDSPALENVKRYFLASPYMLSYKSHMKIQRALWSLIAELNRRKSAKFQIKSRVELNWLWL